MVIANPLTSWQRQCLARKLYEIERIYAVYLREVIYAQLTAGLILSPTANEFHFDKPFLSLATNTGLLVGTTLCGLGCDIWGRKSVYWVR